MQEYLEKFKALSDETRLRIVHLLIRKNTPLCVCEFTDALEVPQYNVSRHLKILKYAKLIEENKEGRWVYFALSKTKDTFTELIFEAIRKIPKSILSKDLEEIDKRLAIRTNGKCLSGVKMEYLLSTHPMKDKTIKKS
jgi:ArsR family transcriptional regulator, arsenate/arsenite/antimonite-responsive transcriptional repressor